jgi:hypothetical protein
MGLLGFHCEPSTADADADPASAGRGPIQPLRPALHSRPAPHSHPAAAAHSLRDMCF